MRAAGSWAQSGGWAIADRGLFSLSNFLVSLLLARWLVDTAYGAFAMAFAVFLLAAALHGGWVAEPLLVYGPSRFDGRFSSYLGYVLRRHVTFSLWIVAAGAGVVGFAALLGRMEAATALLAATLAAPWILLQWLARLACYASIGPRRAALAGGAQLLFVLVLLGVFQRLSALSTEAAFGLMGVAAGLTGLVLVASLRPTLRGHQALELEARRLHRDYGKWAGATGLLTWIPGQVYYVLLPIVGATAAAGNLRAVMNLVLPMLQAYVALSTVLTTSLARARLPEAEPGRFNRIVSTALVLLALAAAVYWVLLAWLGPPVMRWLYDGRYDELAFLLPVVGLVPLLGVGATVLAPALRALERPDRVFVAYAASTVVSLTLGLWLTVRLGVLGAAVGLVTTTAVTTLFLAWQLGRSTAEPIPVQSPATSTTLNSVPE